MKMPHFWMTYIKVKNVKLIVDKAHLLGGIVEIEQTLEGFGKVALIRDPLVLDLQFTKVIIFKTPEQKTK